MLAAALLSSVLLCGCGGGGTGGGSTPSPTPAPTPTAAAPTIATSSSNGAQNGALIVTLASATPGAAVYYTLDGSTPSTSSQQYQAPILVDSNIAINAVATVAGSSASSVTSKSFTPSIASGTLVWSEEFANSGASNAQPNPATWTYDIGTNCCGNSELETYCAWASAVSPCNPASPNAYVGTDGYLHIVAQRPTPGAAVYTSARLKTQGLFSFQYGRVEARMMLPESQGMWPAFWLLGDNIVTSSWPACGELDVMEHIDGSNPQNAGYDWVEGSIHGTSLNGGIQYHPTGFSAAGWHTYGMIWTKGQIQYYVDSPGNIYATYTPSTQTGTWPFDTGPEFILLNLAVGGTWPGSPDNTTVFPSQMLVDYVRVYSN
ncbi:MAG TPA: family 16 glycosylhydrolase [Terracidiphilus sp.]|jgi:beta-glucanase (GH16 family)